MATYSIPKTFRKTFFMVKNDEIYERAFKRAAEIAYNVINAALDGVYSVPFVTTPGIILDISDMMTKHFVAQMVPGGNAIDTADEWKMADEWLKEIRSGEKEIPGETRDSTKDAYFNMEEYVPIFGVDSEYNHIPDPDYLDDLGDERLEQ